MDKKQIKIIKGLGLIVLTFVVIFLGIITINRFGDNYENYGGINGALHNQTFVENQIVYSLIEYISQWYNNGCEVMRLYEFETWEYKSSFPLEYNILERIGLIDNYTEDSLKEFITTWPNHWTLFNGLVPNLLFDFGYVGTLIFCIVYIYLLKFFFPTNGNLCFSKTIFLGVLYVIPAMAIFGSWFRNPAFHFALIYSIVFYFYLNFKIK